MRTKSRIQRIRYASLLCSASAAALIGIGAASGAFAQDAATQDATASAKVDDTTVVVVTATRVVRNGYKAPTPTTVLGVEEIAAKAPANLADLVNDLPALSGSATPITTTGSVTPGTNGINSLNLRNLGPNRTLVLLDGQRVAGSTLTGWVDVNDFPEGLVSRVDVVTGGASADWGSDAVAGVVNFVLDRKFTGVKGEISGGATTYGDNTSYKVSLTAGTGFDNNRGHILFSAASDRSNGTNGAPRDWAHNGKLLGPNPLYTVGNGQPQYVTTFTGFAAATTGGIITSGPAKGTYFGPGGIPLQFNYGTVSSNGNFMTGGQAAETFDSLAQSGDLVPDLSRQNLFFRASYDVTSHFSVFAQASYGSSHSREGVLYLPLFGFYPVNPTTNAFLPASVAAAAGTTPFTLGSFTQDIGIITSVTTRDSTRFVVGANGDFDAFGSNWNWDAYAQTTTNDIYVSSHEVQTANLFNAIDAVRNPSTGAIQCASVATNPTCVPYNLFGTGVNSPGAINYLMGWAWGRTELTEDVVAGNLRGEPFSTWAGPVSVAMGLEHRREAVSGSNDPISNGNGWLIGNQHASHGAYSVSEGYFETVVPLAKDQFLAKSLDFNGAVRETDYSTAGAVTTWKAGLTYSPIDDISFRVTRSRDIRAPNLSELFAAGSGAVVHGIIDSVDNVPTGNVLTLARGNTSLEPEIADSTGFGIVLKPRFLEGFEASVDYYDIDISKAIFLASAQQIVDQCAEGNAAACPNIVRTAGVITQVNVVPINLAEQISRGVDYEASYRKHLAPAPFLDGILTVRALATHYLKNYYNNGITPAIDTVGTNSDNGSSAAAGVSQALPNWKYQASLDWKQGPLRLGFTARGVSDGVYNTSYIQCSSNCPVSTAANPTIADNHIPGAIYYDGNISYQFPNGIEAFMVVQNLANTDPVATAYGPSISGSPLPMSPSLYDILGRTFRMGIRFKM
jgi:outer membrane receptor protein involved in Fe transport